MWTLAMASLSREQHAYDLYSSPQTHDAHWRDTTWWPNNYKIACGKE